MTGRRDPEFPGSRHTAMRTSTALLALALAVAGCGGGNAPTTTAGVTTQPDSTTTVPDTPSGELERARARWSDAGLDTYHFLFQDDCGECLPEWAAPRLITVWDGVVYDARQAPGIDGLFDVLEAAIAGGRTVEAIYDREDGHPTDIWIDREDRAHDGGTHLIIHRLDEGLPGEDATLQDLEAARDRWTDTRPPAYEFRTDILCDCEMDVTLWTLVEEDRVVDWRVEWSRDADVSVAPLTISQLFSDLEPLFSQGEVVDGGAAFTGSAEYDPETGYPMWVGLDIEVLDPKGELGELPPRLVFLVRDLAVHEASETRHERSAARWEERGPADYTYVVTEHDIAEGSFGPRHLVTVEDGLVVSVSVEGVAVDLGTVPAYPIPELFAQIDRWRAGGREVETIYDERLGHPVLVIARLGDDVIAFSIHELTPG